jgi:prepilin-type N-terminal cleavage/methylation domain-containing protein
MSTGRTSSGRGGPRAGFTLVELLVSLAIVGMMLIALNTFVFSMGELWGRNTDYRLFHEHVDSVTRFISEEIREASFPPSARANSTPVVIQQITPLSGISDNLLTFDLPAGCRLLNWPDHHPLPEVTCSLQARPDGLYLLWHSRLETTYATTPPRELLLTPFCTSIQYDYYDDNFKRWTQQTTINMDSNSQPVTPQRILLEFTYGKFTAETSVEIPTVIEGMPTY